MCDPATAMMIGSTALSVTGAITQGDQQKKFYNHQADQATADAEAERQMGEVRAGKIRKAGALVQSEVTAGYAGSGIDINSGTPVAVGQKVERNIEEDARTELLTGQKRGRALEATAAGHRAAGKNAQTNAMFAAGSSILGGTANYMDYSNNRDRWIRRQNTEDRRSLAAGGMGTGMSGSRSDPNW